MHISYSITITNQDNKEVIILHSKWVNFDGKVPKFTPSVNENMEKVLKINREVHKDFASFSETNTAVRDGRDEFQLCNCIAQKTSWMWWKERHCQLYQMGFCRVQGASKTWSDLIIEMPCFFESIFSIFVLDSVYLSSFWNFWIEKSQMYKKAPPPPKCGLVGSLTSPPVTGQSKIDTPFHW